MRQGAGDHGVDVVVADAGLVVAVEAALVAEDAHEPSTTADAATTANRRDRPKTRG
jgi:hypothetical protein